MTLRTNKMTKRKTEYEASAPLDNCAICDKDGERRGKWKIVPNLFPYDRIASKHDLLVPIRHVSEHHLLRESEKTQLQSIKASRSLSEKYSLVLENLGKQRSLPGHLHIHLIRLR
jgi:diadenosine tetraphosphate (Ap4A) HIT family hydrolase